MTAGVFRERVTVRLIDGPDGQYDAEASVWRDTEAGQVSWQGTLTRLPGTRSLEPVSTAGHGRVEYEGESGKFRVVPDPRVVLDDETDDLVNRVTFKGVGDPPSWVP